MIGTNTVIPAIRPEPVCEKGKYVGHLRDAELLEKKVIAVMIPMCVFTFSFLYENTLDAKR